METANIQQVSVTDLDNQRNAYNVAHADHEGLHSVLFVGMFIFLILSQLGLYLWKKKYYRSFQSTTLIGLWIIPFLMSGFLWFFRMLFVWTAWSAVTGYIIKKASQNPLQKDTPRKVYAWFYLLYRVCYSCAIFGYVLFMIDFLGVAHVIPHQVWHSLLPLSYFGGLLLFYGLYFGVLSRDCAEMCADRMASRMGFTGKGLPSKGLPINTCCICGEQYKPEEAIQLNCKHQFHEWCIRGWTMIGKKETCPYCSEKVQLKQLFRNPWEKQGMMWAHILDSLRYLIVWNPIILTVVQVVLYFIDPGA